MRRRVTRCTHVGEVFKDGSLPGLLALHLLLTAIPKIEGLRFVLAAEEHQRVLAIVEGSPEGAIVPLASRVW